MTTLLSTGKRKWDSATAHVDGSRRVKLKKAGPTHATTKRSVLSSETDDPFPADPITSDPTYFDDFMPRDALPPTPVTSLPSSPPSGLLTEDTDNLITTFVEKLQPSSNYVEDNGKIVSHEDTPNEDDRIKLSETACASNVPQGPRDQARDYVESEPQTLGNPAVERDGITPPDVVHKEVNAAARVGSQLERGANSTSNQAVPFCEAEHLSSEPRMNPSLESVDLPVDSESGKPGRRPTPISYTASACCRAGAETRSKGFRQQGSTDESTAPSHRDEPSRVRICVPSKKVGAKFKAQAGKPMKRREAKRHGLQFDIAETGTSSTLAYVVRHTSESGASIGTEWQSNNLQTSFHKLVTQFAKLKYNLGDFVKISFPQGQGGAARIVEIRGNEEPCIVVQWLYSRTDAARSGAKLPSLERWPKTMCMLSDHFQIVGVENVDGGSGLRPIDSVYWQVAGRCLRPGTELQEKLDEQLN